MKSAIVYQPLVEAIEGGIVLKASLEKAAGQKGRCAILHPNNLYIEKDLCSILRARVTSCDDGAIELEISPAIGFDIFLILPNTYYEIVNPAVQTNRFLATSIVLGNKNRLYDPRSEVYLESQYNVPQGYVCRKRLRPVTDPSKSDVYYCFHVAYVLNDEMGTALPVIADMGDHREQPAGTQIDTFGIVENSRRAIRVGAGQWAVDGGMTFLTTMELETSRFESVIGGDAEHHSDPFLDALKRVLVG